MLKALSIILLISLCSSTFLAEEEEVSNYLPSLPQINSINWDELIKCVLDTEHLAHDIADLIEVIKKKDTDMIIHLVYKLLSNGNLVLLQCIKIEPKWEQFFKNLPFKWNDFVKCIEDTQPIFHNVLLLIEAIKDKDYPMALSLTYQLLLKGEKSFKQCMAVFKRTSNKKPPSSPRPRPPQDKQKTVELTMAQLTNLAQCIGKTDNENIEDLLKSITKKKREDANKKLNELLDEGQQKVKDCLDKIK